MRIFNIGLVLLVLFAVNDAGIFTFKFDRECEDKYLGKMYYYENSIFLAEDVHSGGSGCKLMLRNLNTGVLNDPIDSKWLVKYTEMKRF